MAIEGMCAKCGGTTVDYGCQNCITAQRDELAQALLAEIRRTPCGEDCAGGGYHGCSGCEKRAKNALWDLFGRI